MSAEGFGATTTTGSTIWAMPTPDVTSLAANAKASAVAADLAMRAIGNASFVGIVER